MFIQILEVFFGRTRTPEPAVVLSELADSSVNFSVRVWCNSADYWDIYFEMQEKVKLLGDRVLTCLHDGFECRPETR